MALGRREELCWAQAIPPFAHPLRKASRYTRSIPGFGMHSNLLEVSGRVEICNFLQNPCASGCTVSFVALAQGRGRRIFAEQGAREVSIYFAEITKFTAALPFAATATFFSHVLG